MLEDNPSDAALVLHTLRGAGFDTTADRVETEQEFRDRLRSAPEVILADFSLPQFDALSALEILHESRLDIPFIIVSGTIGEERAVEVMRRGASDYIIKDRLGRLGQAVTQALEKKAMRDETRLAERRLGAQQATTRVLAESPDLGAAIPQVFEAVCTSMAWAWGAAWMVVPQGNSLSLVQFWHSPLADVGGFLAACREKTFSLGEGLPGRVWATGEPLWVSDVMRDEQFFGKHAAAQAGLHAAFAFPILLGGEVVGVFEFLSNRIEQPDEKVLGMMAAVGSQLGLFIERKRAEEGLGKSEERFRELTAHLHQVLWIMDIRETKILYVSPSYEKLWGRTCQSLLDNPGSYLENFHPLDMQMMEVANAAMFRTGYIDVECRVLRPDGSVRWVWIRGYPISEGGQMVRVAGVVEDVTEKRRLAVERDALLTRLQVQIERMPLAYVLFDDSILISDWNPAAERIFGYTKPEALGMGPVDLIPVSYRPKSEEIIRRIRGGDLNAHSVNENVTKDGRTITCEWINTPIIEEGGRFAGILCLAQDVTEQIRLEEQYSQAQQRLKHVMASSPAVLYTLLIDEDRIRGINWISQNLLDVTGYAPEDALSADWWREKVHPEDLERVVAQSHAELLSHGRMNHEYRFRHKDGTYRWMRGDLRLMRDGDGRILEVVGSWLDITERKALEDQFRQAQKMEAFGQLAGGVAHDFNNLLTVISGYSDMLLDSLRSEDRNRVLVQEIHTAGSRAALLTGQLLAFSRKQVTQPRVLDINALVASTEKMLGRLIGEDVLLTTVPAPGLDRVKADAGQIEQVILNLVVNARDAMPQGGRIAIESANVEISDRDQQIQPQVVPGRYVMLAISDTGCGMTDDVLTRMFEPYFTTKEVGKGTGLGLATVFGIVQQSGGHIGVTSAVGRGTTFKMYFPAVAEVVPTTPLDLPGSDSAGTETILIVEDERAVRAVTCLSLRTKGYTLLEAVNVSTADSNRATFAASRGPPWSTTGNIFSPQIPQSHSEGNLWRKNVEKKVARFWPRKWPRFKPRSTSNGDDAVRLCEAHPGPIHLLVSDVVMPGMGGRQLAERLSLIRPDMRVMFVSGFTDDAVVRHGVRHAEVAFLQKPFSADAIRRKVRAVLDGGR